MFTTTAEHYHREAEEQRYQEARAARERFEPRAGGYVICTACSGNGGFEVQAAPRWVECQTCGGEGTVQAPARGGRD